MQSGFYIKIKREFKKVRFDSDNNVNNDKIQK